MKKQIRQGVFETNSSSMHALVFKTKYKEDGDIKELGLPTVVDFSLNKYIETDELDTSENRIMFLYNMVMCYGEKPDVITFLSVLDELGIKYILPKDGTEHQYCPSCDEIAELILTSRTKLIQFICAYDVCYSTICDDCCSEEDVDKWFDEMLEKKNEEGAIYLRGEDR